MPQVAKVLTPLSATEAEREIALAWRRRFDAPISLDVLRLLIALWDLETAAGLAQTNNNFGNIIATRDDQLFYSGTDSGNARRFRSYNSVSDGADGLVSQITSATRPHWKAGLMTGDPTNFVVGLKTVPAYFEAPFNQYLTTFLGRWEKYPHLSPAPGQESDQSGATVSRRSGSGLVLLAFLLPSVLGVAYAMRKR